MKPFDPMSGVVQHSRAAGRIDPRGNEVLAVHRLDGKGRY
jgi:hypothetical protein